LRSSRAARWQLASAVFHASTGRVFRRGERRLDERRACAAGHDPVSEAARHNSRGIDAGVRHVLRVALATRKLRTMTGDRG
jgi:hypothetical protein